MRSKSVLLMAACLLAIAGCGGEGGSAGFASSVFYGSGWHKDVRVDALPITADRTVLDHLSDLGRASGYQYANDPSDALQVPVSVAPGDAGIATQEIFFGGDQSDWTLLRTGSSNNSGVIAGYGIVGGTYTTWTWDGNPVNRYPAPDGEYIEKVVGPADDGSFAVDVYNANTVKQDILKWSPDGGPVSIYNISPVKAGMTLVGMASNGLIGGVERDGYLLTPKIYDGQWQALDFDYNGCYCEAKRVNASGQMLMTPRFDLNPDARGYLAGSTGATVLPRLGADTRYADLNDRGDIVGSSGNSAIIIINGRLWDLNHYANSAALGWHFDSAVAINNQRQVVGLGVWQGQQRWYLLSLK